MTYIKVLENENTSMLNYYVLQVKSFEVFFVGIFLKHFETNYTDTAFLNWDFYVMLQVMVVSARPHTYYAYSSCIKRSMAKIIDYLWDHGFVL